LLLYYITDRSQLAADETERRRRLLASIANAASAGIDYVQLREKNLPVRDLLELAQRAVEAVAGTRTRLLINSRVDIAIGSGAHGVHLPAKRELSASEARVIWHKAGITNPVISTSCHSMDEIVAAESQGADFAVFGPVFEKSGVPAPDGLAGLTRVCGRPPIPGSRMPVLALGGVTLANAPLCLDAGADGIAAIRLFQADPAAMAAAVAALRKLQPAKRASGEQPRHPYQDR
jgi:thiamine-phosphate pyrophosphorylase